MQPFVQVESHGNAQKNGTGLGLFICKQLAQRMGGALTLESEFGKGSTFTVTLPTVEFSTRRKMEPSEADDSMTIVRRDLRILVVDDVPVNRHVLQAMLKHLQIQHVTFAENGAEALRLLHDAPDAFNLILTDLWMPEMNGEALVREIRRDQRWQELPVYAVTADAEAQRSFAESGFTGLLLKPVTLDKLRAIILKADEPQRHPAEPTGGK
jgi:two-component system sensor histidine kinase EvgS